MSKVVNITSVPFKPHRDAGFFLRHKLKERIVKYYYANTYLFDLIA